MEKLDIEGDAKEFMQENAQVVQMLKENKTNIQISRSLQGLSPQQVEKTRQRYQRLKAIKTWQECQELLIFTQDNLLGQKARYWCL